MDWIFYLGLILLILGALAFLGMKILPVKKNVNIIFIVIGILIVTGLGASLWGGLTSLAVVHPTQTNTAPNANAYSYSILAKVNVAKLLQALNIRKYVKKTLRLHNS